MGDTTVIALDEALDLRAAKPLAEALLARRGADLTLDASGVRRLSSLCLQVLLSAKTTWAADGRSLSVVEPSPAFSDGLRLLGAADLLCC